MTVFFEGKRIFSSLFSAQGVEIERSWSKNEDDFEKTKFDWLLPELFLISVEDEILELNEKRRSIRKELPELIGMVN